MTKNVLWSELADCCRKRNAMEIYELLRDGDLSVYQIGHKIGRGSRYVLSLAEEYGLTIVRLPGPKREWIIGR